MLEKNVKKVDFPIHISLQKWGHPIWRPVQNHDAFPASLSNSYPVLLHVNGYTIDIGDLDCRRIPSARDPL